MVRFHDTGFDMVSLKNPIIIKKGDIMKVTANQKDQKNWKRTQEVLDLRKNQEDYKKSFRLTAEARRRFCR